MQSEIKYGVRSKTRLGGTSHYSYRGSLSLFFLIRFPQIGNASNTWQVSDHIPSHPIPSTPSSTCFVHTASRPSSGKGKAGQGRAGQGRVRQDHEKAPSFYAWSPPSSWGPFFSGHLVTNDERGLIWLLPPRHLATWSETLSKKRKKRGPFSTGWALVVMAVVRVCDCSAAEAR